MGRSVAMRTCLALALVAVVAMATAEDHQVEQLDSKDMVKPMSSNVNQLQEEVHYLRNQVDAIAAKTKVDMREQLNAQKEKYYKNRKKAAYGQGLRRTVAGLQQKMAGAVQATVNLEGKLQKDKAKIAQLKGATRSPADIAKIAKLKNKIKELESHHGNLQAQIAAEKKKARSAHKAAAKLSKVAAKAHTAGSRHEMSKSAAKASQAAAQHDNLKSEKEAAKADAKAAKKSWLSRLRHSKRRPLMRRRRPRRWPPRRLRRRRMPRRQRHFRKRLPRRRRRRTSPWRRKSRRN